MVVSPEDSARRGRAWRNNQRSIKCLAYTIQQLLLAGAHFGHLTRRWNPKMRPFIFMEKNGVHILDLKKTEGSP